MRKTGIFSALILTLILAVPILSQNAQKGIPEKDTSYYRPVVKYPLHEYGVYKMNEVTDVFREYSDGSQKKYTRDITYFFTQYIPDLPKDGFNTVRVSVDSLHYKFQVGDAIYEWNSQVDTLAPPNFPDLNAVSIALGRDFDMIYSPYGELAKIEGEKLSWLKNYIVVEGKDKLDSLKKNIWLRGISTEHLKYLTDLQKGIIPPGKVRRDSVWATPFDIQLDEVNFYDTAQSRIKDYNAGILSLESSFSKLKPAEETVRLYDINQLVNTTEGQGSGKYEISIGGNGWISNALLETEAQLKAKVKNEEFTQKIKTKATWELLNHFKY